MSDEITGDFISTIDQVTIEMVTGDPGSDGKSAYAIWLGLGNTGTEQDFINSLKGDSGNGNSGNSDTSKFYQAVTVGSYANAVTEANGVQKKIITVTADENDGTNTESLFIYQGNNTLGYKFPKTYVTA